MVYDSLKLTDDQRRLARLDIEDRANEIKKMMDGMTPKEKLVLLSKLKASKILTDETRKRVFGLEEEDINYKLRKMLEQ